MCLRRFTLPCLLFLLGFYVLPIHAVPPPHPSLRSDIIYTSRGEFVQVSPMRPLTLNAHVQQFAYDPLGIEVAFTGSEAQGDQAVYFVKMVTTPMRKRTGFLGNAHGNPSRWLPKAVSPPCFCRANVLVFVRMPICCRGSHLCPPLTRRVSLKRLKVIPLP